MAEWNRDRGGRYSGRDRNDHFGRNYDDYGYGRSEFDDERFGAGMRWGSGDYRQNYDRSRRNEPSAGEYGIDRDEYAGARGGGFLGGAYSSSDFAERDSGRGYDAQTERADRGDFRRGYGRTENRPTYGSRGSSAGSGGWDYETYPESDFGIDRGYDRGRGFGSSATRYGDSGTLRGERQSFRGRGPKGFHRTDERLRELISERLEDHDHIDASEIEVSVSNGEVTLTGTVDDRRTKRLAEDVADSVIGVRDVHNNLKVDKGFFSRMADSVREAVQGEDQGTRR